MFARVSTCVWRHVALFWLGLVATGAACAGQRARTLESAVDGRAGIVSPTMRMAAETITGELLREHVRELASDRYEGRGPATPGGELATAYLERQLQRLPAVSFSEGMEVVGRPRGWGRAQIERYEAERYHQPSDELDDSWNFDGMVDDARLGLWVGMAIANANELPAWVPGDEFEAALKAALRARVSRRAAAP